MRKLRIYLDTSVISNLIADDAPKMGVNSINLRLGYKEIEIVSPLSIVKEEEE